MAVTYDVVYKNNRRIPISGPCFGGFSDARSYPSHSIRRAFATSRGLQNDEMRSMYDNPQDAAFIQFYAEPQGEYWRDGNEEAQVWKRRYFDEMSALAKDIPWLDFSVHPLLGVIRVPVEGKPADQIMMTLFLVRNLAHYDYAIGYRELRGQGFKPMAAAIFSSFWKKSKGNTFTPGSWFYVTVGEYNWLSPWTFGKQALEQMLNADATFNPWVQGIWSTQGCYRRDRYFQEQRSYFHNPPGSENGDNPSRCRRLIDCLSIPADEPLWSIVRTEWESRSGGRIYTYYRWGVVSPEQSNPSYSPQDFVPQVDEFIALCRGYGYDPIITE